MHIILIMLFVGCLGQAGDLGNYLKKNGVEDSRLIAVTKSKPKNLFEPKPEEDITLSLDPDYTPGTDGIHRLDQFVLDAMKSKQQLEQAIQKRVSAVLPKGVDFKATTGTQSVKAEFQIKF